MVISIVFDHVAAPVRKKANPAGEEVRRFVADLLYYFRPFLRSLPLSLTFFFVLRLYSCLKHETSGEIVLRRGWAWSYCKLQQPSFERRCGCLSLIYSLLMHIINQKDTCLESVV
ncbi:hypothetical protein Y032_0154g2971 [Ancylostoma ceylanicum]|uniref:Uncharacterized protein n=1 Tax=Ancylostoma ceylanicum TaxID=53326 RepID=A0A016SZV1_9BILA|nr:hypothetical protein Y032_0154g2971 [Ancylostoma ceylanicum]